MKFLRNGCFILLLSGTLLILPACTKQDFKDLADIAKMWAAAHDLMDDQGKPNYVNIGARTTFGISTGDAEADAAIDAGAVVHNFQEAEKLSNEGKNRGDIKKVDAAIKLRPGEFTYRNQRGSMDFFEGNLTKAEKDFAEAEKLAEKYGKVSRLRNIESRITSLTYQFNKYIQNLAHPSADNEEEIKSRYHKIMSDSFYERYTFTKDPSDQIRAGKHKSASER
ncbi:MAG TPA: hypothetical protein VGE40_05815 [Bacilli bacterium]